MIGVGFCFHPTEEELVSYYLKKKILGQPLLRKEEESCLVDKDLYGDKATPWDLFSDDLPWQKVIDTSYRNVESQKILYVVTSLSNVAKKNSKNNKQKNRRAGCGTWHANASAKPVLDSYGRKIGESKNFTFESPEETVGQWTMVEYSIDAAANDIPELGVTDRVLCRIKRDDSKSSKDGRIVSRKRKNDEGVLVEAGQNSKKKLKSVSSVEELSVLTCDDVSAATTVNNDEAGISYGSFDFGDTPLLMNVEDSAAGSSVRCNIQIPDDEELWFNSNLANFDIDVFLKELVAY